MSGQKNTERKAALRKAVRARCNSLTEEELRTHSEAAQNLILSEPAWAAAPSVALYYAVRQELRTQKLLNKAWETGKRVFLPYTRPDKSGIIRLLFCPSAKALARGAFGIMEPDPALCGPLSKSLPLPELIIVPGIAFDRLGNRLGTGGGYYDRLFADPSMRNAKRLGLAYSFQIYDALPIEPWDVPMHGICTEQGLRWLR